ncbi:MAG: ATP-binding protein, partial [Acidobacteriota bacterium]
MFFKVRTVEISGRSRQTDVCYNRAMGRFFNTEGPVRPDENYCLPPLGRLDLGQVLDLIDRKRYFILHAPRQTGKTSCLLALTEHLNREGRYRCLYVNLEVAQTAREDVGRGVKAILSVLGTRARQYLGDGYPESIAQSAPREAGEDAALGHVLTLWAERSRSPLVILFDEIDSLIGDTLVSVLRQLREGYEKRPTNFPQSVVLCGVRDVKDYRIYSSREKTQITGGSAFNIKAESLRLGDFTRDDVHTLYKQHTEETGQAFEGNALEFAWDLTRGQPWLVNALAYRACFKMKAGRDRSKPITAGMILDAKEQLIIERVTHLDQLADKLSELRVRRVIEPMLGGGTFSKAPSDDDIRYVTDLGLILRGTEGLQVANPIYREVIPRQLSDLAQAEFETTHDVAWYLRSDGTLDMPKLLGAFQEFFRESSEIWLERFAYKEAGPQLLMQAFLQRIVNGGGYIQREYGLGLGRTDLMLIWPHAGGRQKVAIELKLVRKSVERTIAEGLAQTSAYMDRCGAEDEGHLVIFDRRRGRS